MKNLGSRPKRKMRAPLEIPEIQLLVAGFSLSLVWEVLQSPFYTDTFELSWTGLAFNRLHCAGGDVVILLGAFWGVSLRWGRFWMQAGKWAPLAVFLSLSFAYTALSEHYNVHLVRRWAYSRWMPTILGIGLVPLMQWVVVPTLCVRFIKRDARWQRWNVTRRIVGSMSSRPYDGEQI